MEQKEEKSMWSLDKHIPVVFLVGIALQTLVWLWWGATFTAQTNLRLEALEKSNEERTHSKLPERMARVEALMESNNMLLTDIRDTLSVLKKQAGMQQDGN